LYWQRTKRLDIPLEQTEDYRERSLVKDIILWQSAAARKREEEYLTALSALHQSVYPPGELQLPVPRKLRWKRALKLAVAFDAALLVAVICMSIKFCSMEAGFYSDMATENQRHIEKLRRETVQTTDPERRAKIQKSIRESEDFGRKWRLLNAALLTLILGTVLATPSLHMTLSWFTQIRPELILLRSGIPVRGTVVSKKTWFLAKRLEIAFTTERGESIRKKQILRDREAGVFSNGSPLWMLYSPSRPTRAKIYGLRSALAEVVR
jgi:hypothetical protein